MRAFYQTYRDQHDLLELAMRIGWTRNVLILEAESDLRGTGLVSERCPAVWVDEDYSERKVAESAHLSEAALDDSQLCGILKAVKLLAGKGGNRA